MAFLAQEFGKCYWHLAPGAKDANILQFAGLHPHKKNWLAPNVNYILWGNVQLETASY